MQKARFSAYLSLYEDWDILQLALRSMHGRIDELVVVDGAHQWMSPLLSKIGKDPLRWNEAVYDIISDCGIPTRVINSVWENEVQKRIAGYAACNADYIYRIDADEVMFFDEEALRTFFDRGEAVAEMTMPLYDSPGFLHAGELGSPIGKQSFLFKSKDISAEQHLHYLWLVLGADILPPYGGDKLPVFERPIAFNAHLSTWRTSRGAAQRAEFYWMNWMRANGCPFVPELSGSPITDFQRFFELVSPNDFHEALMRSEVANNHARIVGKTIIPSPLSAADEGIFSNLYHRHVESAMNLNVVASLSEQAFISGIPVCFLVRSAHADLVVTQNVTVDVGANCAMSRCEAKLSILSSVEPFVDEVVLSVFRDRTDFTINIPDDYSYPRSGELRCVMSFTIWLEDGHSTGKFTLGHAVGVQA